MKKPSVDEVLNEGIYGPKEIKPEERRRFLGTLRERIILALMNTQVKEQKIYPQVEQFMKGNPAAHLFLNGSIEYEQLSKYVKLAKKYKMNHTIVSNKEHETDIGLVLAMEHAIDKEDIYIKISEPIEEKQPAEEKKKKSSFFAKLFKR